LEVKGNGVRVVKLTPVDDKGNLRAFADVEVNSTFILHSCRVIQQPGQRPWVSMPQAEVLKDGKKLYYPIVKILDKQLEAEIKQAVLSAYEGGGTL